MDRYAQEEYSIACDPTHPSHCLPQIPDSATRVLDIGCGAGQTLAALRGRYMRVGIDINHVDLVSGAGRWELRLTQGSGEALPFSTATFDFIMCRVALPYMHIPTVLKEVSRVLRPNGSCWFMMHPFRFAWHELLEARSLKNALYRGYILANILANGVGFHLSGKTFAVGHKVQSFQTARGCRLAFANASLSITASQHVPHFVVLAKKPSSSRTIGAC
jgi:ubiquinone/menaquinone biosynthesis C-methylase UbiE